MGRKKRNRPPADTDSEQFQSHEDRAEELRTAIIQEAIKLTKRQTTSIGKLREATEQYLAEVGKRHEG